MRPRELEWTCCNGGWCRLKDVFLTGMARHYGVYIIWRKGVPSRRIRVLYVGQGKHQATNPSVPAQHPGIPKGREGDLRVTWALVKHGDGGQVSSGIWLMS